ncbi:MAG: ABC transporter ATP-binding protein [Deltaproteobacteria bacterium GWA2_47_9]|nr:MAG: ABC transporter ATP-binding protein [Deltaproteobacteria bacterium GWA2_47_9]
MLKLSKIHIHYGKIEALKGISLELNQGEIVSLIGANGAGKSTALMAISGIIKPSKGHIEFEGKRIDSISPDAVVKLGISQVPEGRRIFPRLTVKENLLLGAYLRKDRIENDLEHIFGIFPILKERLNQTGGTLSGGEQQMLAIGRALMGRPRLLLLDEPSLGLAPIFVSKIFEVIQEINREGVTVLLVEQNAHLALQVSHRGYILETGRIVNHDESHRLLNNEEVREAYLG